MPTYMRHPLDDCFERVNRASEHLVELENGIRNAREAQADTVPIEFDRDPPHRITHRVHPETFYGMRMGIVVGEICYNLRSALDYLVFDLAELDSGAPQNGTQFPIIDLQQEFVGRTKIWLDPDDVAESISHALRYDGRRRRV